MEDDIILNHNDDINDEKEIKKIENDLYDLAQISHDLNTMVGQQGESLNHVETEVDKADEIVEKGTEEIEKAKKFYFKNKKIKVLACGILAGPVAGGLAGLPVVGIAIAAASGCVIGYFT